MADEEGLEPEEQNETPDEAWKSELRKLRKENQELRNRAKAAKFEQLKSKYPGLEPDDLDGIPFDKLDSLLAKVAAQPAQVVEEPKTEAVTNTVPADEVATLAAAAALSGTPAVTPGKTYSAEEIRQIGLRDQAEALRIIEKQMNR